MRAILMVFLLLANLTHGQQLPLYSQYVWNNYIFNPAFTGSLNYNPVQITYRKQWVGFNGSPELFTAGGHARLNEKIALGGLVFKDATGGAFSQTGIILNYSYKVRLSSEYQLAFGLSGNINQYSFDNSKVISLVPNDPALNQGLQKSLAPDASFGVLVQKKQKFKMGFSVLQLFESNLNGINEVAPNNLVRHYTLNLEKTFQIDSIFRIQPALLLKGTSSSPLQVDIMTAVKFKDLVWAGVSYRNNDAIVGLFGFNYKNIFVNYSYDATTSEISSYANGTHEIVLGVRLGEKSEDYPLDSDRDGILDKDDRCPTVPGLVENSGCPWLDRDKDGIEDSFDLCPDIYGSPKNKGCPISDKDGDGIPDSEDGCPNTRGLDSNNGCPVVTKEEKEIVSKAITNLEFEFNKSTIRKDSYLGLDMLAILLSEKPDWKLKLSGHTDDVGSDSFNLQLSKDRAEAVRDYLISKGLVKERFLIEYFGKNKPINSNQTEEGRKENRRVEMTFVFD